MVLTLDIAATRVTMLMAPRRRNCESCPPHKRHTYPRRRIVRSRRSADTYHIYVAARFSSTLISTLHMLSLVRRGFHKKRKRIMPETYYISKFVIQSSSSKAIPWNRKLWNGYLIFILFIEVVYRDGASNNFYPFYQALIILQNIFIDHRVSLNTSCI